MIEPARQKMEKNRARDLRHSRWWQTLIQSASCYYCNCKLLPEEVTMDHVVPISRGGRSTQGNVVPCCKPCNSHKKNKTAVDLILEDLETKPSEH